MRCFKCFSLRHNFRNIIVNFVCLWFFCVCVFSLTGQFYSLQAGLWSGRSEGPSWWSQVCLQIDPLTNCHFVIRLTSQALIIPLNPSAKLFSFFLRKKLFDVDFYIFEQTRKRPCGFFQTPRPPKKRLFVHFNCIFCCSELANDILASHAKQPGSGANPSCCSGVHLFAMFVFWYLPSS